MNSITILIFVFVSVVIPPFWSRLVRIEVRFKLYLEKLLFIKTTKSVCLSTFTLRIYNCCKASGPDSLLDYTSQRPLGAFRGGRAWDSRPSTFDFRFEIKKIKLLGESTFNLFFPQRQKLDLKILEQNSFTVFFLLNLCQNDI